MQSGWWMALVGSALLGCGNPRAGGATVEGGDGGATAQCPGEGYISCRDDDACPCGLVCARLTTVTAERYCTQTCDRDDDCARSSRWAFSSSGCNPRTNVCIPR